jgi:hypothetical protein
MAKRSKPTPKNPDSASPLGHLLVYDGTSFYFIPAERVGPPMVVSSEDTRKILANIQKLESEVPGSRVLAVRIKPKELPIKLFGHN